MTALPRLDHIAVLVRDTDAAVAYFRDRLGLALSSTEVLSSSPVRLTYLECENISVQLLEPVDPDSELGRTLAHQGEGLHHICLSVDDAPAEALRLADEGSLPPPIGQGRRKRSAFVPGPVHHGVRVECTEIQPMSASEQG